MAKRRGDCGHRLPPICPPDDDALVISCTGQVGAHRVPSQTLDKGLVALQETKCIQDWHAR